MQHIFPTPKLSSTPFGYVYFDPLHALTLCVYHQTRDACLIWRCLVTFPHIIPALNSKQSSILAHPDSLLCHSLCERMKVDYSSAVLYFIFPSISLDQCFDQSDLYIVLHVRLSMKAMSLPNTTSGGVRHADGT